MAWWNNPAGGRTPEVSLERVAAWFDAQGFAYELTEDGPGLAAGFGRYSYVIEVLDDIMAIHARFWTNLPDDEATATGVRGLLSQFNRSRVVPTLASFVNDDGHQMAAQIPVFIAQGLNDDQLDDVLNTCLQAIEDCFDELAEALGIGGGADGDDGDGAGGTDGAGGADDDAGAVGTADGDGTDDAGGGEDADDGDE